MVEVALDPAVGGLTVPHTNYGASVSIKDPDAAHPFLS